MGTSFLTRPVSGGIWTVLMIGTGAVALFLGIFFSSQAGLLALAGAWVAFGSWKYPKEALYILLFFVPILPIIHTTGVFTVVTILKDVVIGALFVGVVILPIVRKEDPYRRNLLLVPILFFIAWAGVAFLFSDQQVLGLLRLRDLLLYIPLFWIARSLMQTRQDVFTLLKVLGISAGLVLVLGAFQMIGAPDSAVQRFDPAMNEWIPRLSSTLAHPNLLGGYLLFIVPLAFAIAFQRGVRVPYRLLAGIIAGFSLIATYATFSRSAWISIAGAGIILALIIVIRQRYIPVRLFALGAAILVLGVALIPHTRTLVQTTFDPTYQSNVERLEILAQLIADASPVDAVLGRGLGNVTGGTGQDIRVSLQDVVAADAEVVRDAKARTLVDNAVLKTWIEMGVVGVVFMGWIGLRALLLGWNTAFRLKTPEFRMFAAAFTATTFGLFLLSLFLDVPEIFPIALMFWTFGGVVSALPYMREEREVT